jgi:hypothetical protein
VTSVPSESHAEVRWTPGTPHLMSASMMAPQMSSTADGRCLNAVAPCCRNLAVSSVLASVSHGISDTGFSDLSPTIDTCDSTSAAAPRPYSRGPACAPHAHTRSRNVRMPKVSTAAATSP